MKKRMRVMAMILAAALCVSSTPFSVLAEEMETEVVTESAESAIDDIPPENVEQVEDADIENEVNQEIDVVVEMEAEEETDSKDTSMSAIVDSGTCGENLTWTLDNNNTLIISGKGDMADYSFDGSPFRDEADGVHRFKSIIIEDGVTSIGDWAFPGCSNLISITIPNSVTSIGVGAFWACTGLTSIIIPKNVTYFGEAAFSDCYGLTSINVDEGNTSYSSYDGVLFNKSQTTLIACPSGKSGSFSIPNGVHNIGNRAFSGCNSLASITIPNSVTSIGVEGFWACSSLRSIIIPKGVTSISASAFGECSELTIVTIPNSVTGIEENAFLGCCSLTSITIPSSITRIYGGAFSGSGVKEVYYTGTEEEWNKLVISDGNEPLQNATIHFNSTGPGQETIPDAQEVNYTAEYYHLDEKSKGYYQLKYNENDFAKDSSVYNHELARFAIGLSTMAYSDDEHMKNTLKEIGYKDVTDYKDKTGTTSPFWASHKKVMLNGEETELLNIVIRGTYNEEWVDNFDPGVGDTHKGFQRAAQFVLDNTKKYINDAASFNKSAKVKVLITGHSRGAAAANLLGAMLNQNGDIGAASSLKKSDIFVYTFATPNPTSKAINQANYNNIYNIVNPEDFVTKVLLYQWGYHRYGVTYVLPSATTEQGKKEPYVQYENMYLPRIRNIYNTICCNAGGYKPYQNGMNELLKYVKKVYSNVDDIHKFYNYDLRMGFMFDGKVGTSLQQLYRNALGMNQSNNKEWELLSYTVMADALDNGYGIVGLDTMIFFFVHQKLRPDFAKAHRAETYLAGMMSLDENQLTANRRITEGIVNCPVDVTVKDEDGNIVGRIVNNTIDETIENGITMTVEGDSKVFYMPAQNKYTVELTGNDNGAMDYSLADVSPDTGEESRVFYGYIPVVKEETLTQEILPETELSNDILLDNKGSEVSPTAVISNEELGGLKAEVMVEGPGSAAGIENATPGDYITLSAFPEENGEFSGWYDETGTLLSQDADYSFSISKDMKFKAVFSEKKQQPGSDGSNQNNGANISNNTVTPVPATSNSASATVSAPAATKLKKVKAGKKKATLKWKKVSDATGYEIQYGIKKNFKKAKTKTIKKAKTVKATIKKLKAGKKYYFRIRTYKTVNGVKYYSAWSKAKKVKIK